MPVRWVVELNDHSHDLPQHEFFLEERKPENFHRYQDRFLTPVIGYRVHIDSGGIDGLCQCVFEDPFLYAFEHICLI